VVEQGTHKPLVGGSNPPSATNAHFVPDIRMYPRPLRPPCSLTAPSRLPPSPRKASPQQQNARPSPADTTIPSPTPSSRPRTMRMIGAAGLRPRRVSYGTRVVAKRIEHRSGRPSGIAIGPSLVDLPRVPSVARWLRLAVICHLTRPDIVPAAHNPPSHPIRTYGRIPFRRRP
jgi:hypothetical protein